VPMSQEIIGDLLGLSIPHVNRMLRQLREQGLISARNHTITIEDATRLQFLAKYEPRMPKGISPCGARLYRADDAAGRISESVRRVGKDPAPTALRPPNA
jgi:hypothetical protein